MKPGDLCISDSCHLWDVPSHISMGSIVGNTQQGDLVLVLEILDDDIRVLSPHGVGWLGSTTIEKRKLLHETR